MIWQELDVIDYLPEMVANTKIIGTKLACIVVTKWIPEM